jgi:hypothetical protein
MEQRLIYQARDMVKREMEIKGRAIEVYWNIIAKELQHDPNECYRHCQEAPRRDHARDRL